MKKLIAITIVLVLALAALSATAETTLTISDMPNIIMEDENTTIDESMFEGEWVVDKTFLGEEYIDPNELAALIRFDFGPISIGSGTIIQEYTVDGEIKSVEMPYTFEAGQLQGECPENGFQYVVEPLEGDGICYSLFVPDEEGNITCATIFMVRK